MLSLLSGNDFSRGFFILKQIKLIFTRKAVHLVSFWKWGFLELWSGLFPIGKFRPGNQDFLVKRSVAPGNLPPKRPEKSCSIYFPTGFCRNFLSTTIVSAQETITINDARLLACVAGVRKGRGRRGRELGRETAREGGGRRLLSFLLRAPKFPLPLLSPATQATCLRVFIISTTT